MESKEKLENKLQKEMKLLITIILSFLLVVSFMEEFLRQNNNPAILEFLILGLWVLICAFATYKTSIKLFYRLTYFSVSVFIIFILFRFGLLLRDLLRSNSYGIIFYLNTLFFSKFFLFLSIFMLIFFIIVINSKSEGKQ